MATSNDALQFSRTASKLWKCIREIQEETVTGDDCTPQVMEVILDSFLIVESMVEDRYKTLPKVSAVEEVGSGDN